MLLPPRLHHASLQPARVIVRYCAGEFTITFSLYSGCDAAFATCFIPRTEQLARCLPVQLVLTAFKVSLYKVHMSTLGNLLLKSVFCAVYSKLLAATGLGTVPGLATLRTIAVLARPCRAVGVMSN